MRPTLSAVAWKNKASLGAPHTPTSSHTMRLHPLGVISLYLLCTLSSVQALPPSIEEQEALKDFIGAISGLPASWRAAKTQEVCDKPEEWPGITCGHGTTPPSWIQQITVQLMGNATTSVLIGTIPNSISNFTRLEYLDLVHQGLYGTIPQNLLTIPTLRTVRLDYNFLNGSLPEIWTGSPNLNHFSASNNILSGTIPLQVADVALAVFQVENNELRCPFSLDLLKNATVHCNLQENFMEVIDGKICGTIPALVSHHCTTFPQREELQLASLPTDASVHVEHAGIYVQAEDHKLQVYLRQVDGGLFTEEYFIMSVLGATQEGYFTEFKAFAPSFTTHDPGKYSIACELTNGLTVNFQLQMFTNEDGYPQLKVGWVIRNFTLPDPNTDWSLILKFAIRMPLDQFRPFGCETSGIGEPFRDILDLFGDKMELIFSDCSGTHANVSTSVRMSSSQPLASFNFASRKMKMFLDWATVATVDGIDQFLDLRSASFYIKEGGVESSKIGRARRLGIPFNEPSVAPLDQQFLSATMHMDYPPFTDNIYYDPDIRFQLLFGNEGEEVSMAWIAAPICAGVVVVGALAVVLLNSNARAKVFPFLNRSKSTVERVGSHAAPKRWTAGDKSVPLSNTRSELD